MQVFQALAITHHYLQNLCFYYLQHITPQIKNLNQPFKTTLQSGCYAELQSEFLGTVSRPISAFHCALEVELARVLAVYRLPCIAKASFSSPCKYSSLPT